MDNDKEKKIEINDKVKVKDACMFGITEAPKEHPDNQTGHMKVIMG